ncbi:MAG: FAD-dependent oxidoreductase [Pseudomonadota bacterium]|nr:FAD-dependent oxidoreductase [Pseudomonadota bacterium]
MTGRESRFDCLFEPVTIGPVTARNRFYQVPHCNGMGHAMPNSVAAMRGMKAAGGWAVVATEECDIHASTDVLPFPEARLWDDQDARRLELMVEAVHAHGALAAIELVHNGHAVSNRYSRLPVMAVADLPVAALEPSQACSMTRRDIADVRRWHRKAALRARNIGFDIVYVYAGHNLTLGMHFLSRRYNQRHDEYGGTLANRVRLTRELLEDTRDAVGDQCGIAFRFAVDELLGDDGLSCEAEGRDVVEMLAEHPDIWDVNLSDWSNDSVTARFGEEADQEPYVKFVKTVTSRPVVGVGRFTSPDVMVSQIKRGILDMIGAARPSIADPFLPKKIEEGRIDDIRECIGCNICVAGDWSHAPIQCTQNPTMGEEWRRGWHPERMNRKGASDRILVVGAGPAGLEAAMSLGRRGYEVILADAGEGGGRVSLESRLPGLSTWQRVVDYRLGQINKLPDVTFYPGSHMDRDSVLSLNATHVAIATGSTWRRDGRGRTNWRPIDGVQEHIKIFTPDDILAGELPSLGPVVIYDDDHYYLGGIIAEVLVRAGLSVVLVTPAPEVSHWTRNTMEQPRIETLLRQLNVEIQANHKLTSVTQDSVCSSSILTGEATPVYAASLILVTSRAPSNTLYFDLAGADEADLASLTYGIQRIGDCCAPSTIAAAVYHGHRYARELDENVDKDSVPFRREYAAI